MHKQRLMKTPALVLFGLLSFLVVPAAAQAHHIDLKASCDLKNNVATVSYTVDFIQFSSGAKPTTKGTVKVDNVVKTQVPTATINWSTEPGKLSGSTAAAADQTHAVKAEFTWKVNGNWETGVKSVTTNKCPKPPKPGIDVEKVADSATAEAGSTISYTITVANTGDVAFTPTLTDAHCDAAPTRTGANAGDTTFNPGDVWTYTCTVTTDPNASKDENCASATGTVPGVPPVSDEDCAETPLTPPPPPVTPPENPPVTPPTTPANPETPSGGVLPESIASGLARLRGPSGCVKTAFKARVSGRSIASVAFFVDGKLVKQFNKQRASYSVKVKPNRYGFGRHRVIARVRFVAGSGTAARRLPLTFRRCAQGAVAPRFTG